ncbi:GGDEF domain-containing protein [Vibrio navarrensis]|uniref:diguanylate cyclase n=1 Tax=Vibrio navarrensis TaxID=29495 RepID=A0AAJ4ID14_9VIBR|nr:GGDEF domain-containing protein [Vibrio navarrensis]MBE3661139.1 GGDEF domain-containing protein [Vibrio navarrensis]QPL54485.1 GGDEF domain-containing protein [Vibrio navarrensis]
MHPLRIKRPSRHALVIALSMFALLNVTSFVSALGVEDQIDVFTESAYFCILLYIRIALSPSICDYKLIVWGVNLVLAVAMYDTLTEVRILADWSHDYALLDNVIEQGGMFIAVSLIALGIARAMRAKDYEIVRDELTGLYNRRYLDSFSDEDLSLIYIDLNGLKEINDTQGHAKGDELIVRFANKLSHVVEEDEFAFRVGGDEFILLLDPQRVDQVMNHLQALAFAAKIAFSFGISYVNEGNISQRVRLADERMYQMKRNLD